MATSQSRHMSIEAKYLKRRFKKVKCLVCNEDYDANDIEIHLKEKCNKNATTK